MTNQLQRPNRFLAPAQVIAAIFIFMLFCCQASFDMTWWLKDGGMCWINDKNQTVMCVLYELWQAGASAGAAAAHVETGGGMGNRRKSGCVRLVLEPESVSTNKIKTSMFVWRPSGHLSTSLEGAGFKSSLVYQEKPRANGWHLSCGRNIIDPRRTHLITATAELQSRVTGSGLNGPNVVCQRAVLQCSLKWI